MNKNTLAKVRPVATSPVCLYILPSKLNKLFCKAILKCFRRLFLWKLFILALLSKREAQEICTASCNGMLLKRDSTFKLTMNNPESCSITSLVNSNLFLMVNLLVVIGSKIGTKWFLILKAGVLTADKMRRKGGQLLTKFFCFLQRPCNIPNLEPLGL